MSGLYIPLTLAQKQAEDAEAKAKHLSAEQRERDIKRWIVDCRREVADPEAREAIGRLCKEMLNADRFNCDQFTPQEIGRIVSKALLGDKWSCEIKC